MFKALKEGKIIAISVEKEVIVKIGNNDFKTELSPESHFPCMVYDEIIEDTEHTVEDYEQVDGEYLLKQDVPVDYQNEQIRQQRQERYVAESDPLRLDYDEALAREQDNAEQLKQEWLASKEKIREELPYIE